MIQALNHWFDYIVVRNICGIKREQMLDYLQTEMEQCIQEQNRMIYEYAHDKGIQTGTTLTLLMMIDRQYLTAQVGDSRAYRIDDKLIQLTKDQSLVAQEVRVGHLSQEEARHDSRRNIILQCIGASRNLCVDYKTGTACEGEIYFLCSDGFIHVLEDDEIKELLSPKLLNDCATIKKRLKDAVYEVKRRGEKDNITVVLIKIGCF